MKECKRELLALAAMIPLGLIVFMIVVVGSGVMLEAMGVKGFLAVIGASIILVLSIHGFVWGSRVLGLFKDEPDEEDAQ